MKIVISKLKMIMIKKKINLLTWIYIKSRKNHAITIVCFTRLTIRTNPNPRIKLVRMLTLIITKNKMSKSQMRNSYKIQTMWRPNLNLYTLQCIKLVQQVIGDKDIDQHKKSSVKKKK